MSKWATTVNELVQVFRSALLSILPSMEQAHISWKDGEAYDDWDEISQTLYHNIVGRSLQWALGVEDELDTILPQFNMNLSSYEDRSVLQVIGSGVSGIAVFVGLSSDDDPFDMVDYIQVNEDGTVASDILRQPFTGLSFSFHHRPGKKEGLSQLNVDL